MQPGPSKLRAQCRARWPDSRRSTGWKSAEKLGRHLRAPSSSRISVRGQPCGPASARWRGRSLRPRPRAAPDTENVPSLQVHCAADAVGRRVLGLDLRARQTVERPPPPAPQMRKADIRADRASRAAARRRASPRASRGPAPARSSCCSSSRARNREAPAVALGALHLAHLPPEEHLAALRDSMGRT